MASVSGPSTARHPSPFRRQQHKLAARPQGGQPHNGHGAVRHAFVCVSGSAPAVHRRPPTPSPPLANFIAYALHRTRLHTSVTFAALYLLQRLKARFPAARGSSGHRLFISAFMIASKVICDDTYSNKSWSIVGQGMFALREINQMEREMCSYLEWQLNIDPNALQAFEQKVRRDFKGQGPYPTYDLSSPAPSPVPSTTPYAQANGAGPSTSPPKPLPPPVPVHAGNPFSGSSSGGSSSSLPSSAPNTPDTPESSMSTSTSPASSAPPSTPLGYEDHNVRVVSSGTIGTPIAIDSSGPSATGSPARAATYAARAPTAAAAGAVKRSSKCGEMFARAAPCVW
ncbi:hypothetical protein BD413DRAFT_602710 [Trametes elegans]|nr:hypothetical protein BD413DRAFT_602710 [Trametes elegans]